MYNPDNESNIISEMSPLLNYKPHSSKWRPFEHWKKYYRQQKAKNID